MKFTKWLLIPASIMMSLYTNCASQSADPHGAYASGSNIPSSSGGSTTPAPTTSSTNALCNGFAGPKSLNGKIKAYFDQFGNYNSNFVRLRLSGIPENFASDNTLFIEFYRWQVTPAGSIYQDTTPLRFRLENPYTGQAASGYYGPNGSQNVGFNIDAFYKSVNSSNASNLLDYNFLISGTDINLGYQVLRVALTRSYSGQSTVIALTDVLIPMFDVNPNRYAETHAAVLNQLHPNWLKRSEGWADSNYLAFTQQYCF